jgi:hypothetical protein
MTNIQKSEKLRSFLINRPSLSAQGIEREAAIPGQSVAWVKKGRDLPEIHWKSLEPILKKYGWK